MASCMRLTLFVVTILPAISDAVVNETISCDNDWESSECVTQTLSCNATASVCNIHCNGDGSCSESYIDCDNHMNGTHCNIHCNGEHSCSSLSGSSIHCPANTQCNIHCNGDHSCHFTHIHCPASSTSNCTIFADAPFAINAGFIHCFDEDAEELAFGHCVAHCNELQSCDDTKFDGRAAAQLDIHCGNENNACQDMVVACPENRNGSKRCRLTGDEDTVHADIRFYAVQSWDDIDLSGYVGETSSMANSGGQSAMHCGVGYQHSCVMSPYAFNCADNSSLCYRADIAAFPTPTPTTQPTDDGKEDLTDIQLWGIYIGVICGVIMICFCLILAYFYYTKRLHSAHGEYDKVVEPSDPDADLMHHDTRRMYREDVKSGRAPLDKEVVTNGGFHIVREYSDASVFGGLLPITEETSSGAKGDSLSEKKEGDNAETHTGSGSGITDVLSNGRTQTEQLITVVSSERRPAAGVVVVEEEEEEDGNAGGGKKGR